MTIRVGYLGPAFSYSHQIARKTFSKTKLNLISEPNINQLIKDVARGKLEKGVIPFWNSYDSSLRNSQEQIWKEPVIATKIVVLRIKLCLMSNASSCSSIKRIYSNRHVFSQCSRWLEENLPKAEKRSSVSTSKAAKIVKKQKYGAALGAEEAGKRMGLNILAKNIQNPKDVTLFFIIEKEGTDKNKINGIFSLFGIKLKREADRKVIDTIIQEQKKVIQRWTFPLEIGKGFLFFFEIEGHKYDLDVLPFFNKIRMKLPSVKLIGSYDKSITDITAEFI